MLGREGRVNLLIGTNHGLSHFYQLSLPPLFLAWHAQFGVSYAALGVVVMVMSLSTALLQTPMGLLVDRFGARPFIIGAPTMMASGILLMGFATSFWQILPLAMLSGIGNSVTHPADYAILTGSVRRDYLGRSFALHTFAGNVGYILAPIVMTALSLWIGWRGALMAAGLMGLCVAVAIAIQSRILSYQPRGRQAQRGATRALLGSPMLWLFFGLFTATAMAQNGLQAWLITVLKVGQGFSLPLASATLTLLLVGNSVGVLAGGWMADRRPGQVFAVAVLFTLLPAGLLVLAAGLPLPAVGLIMLLCVIGFAMGASRSQRDVLLRAVAPPGQIGTVFGFVSSGLPLGSALAPVPFGFLIDHHLPGLALPLVAVILLGSVACLLAARAAAPGMVAQPAE